MGSLHSLLRMHWDHEPDWRPSPCPLPARRGEGGRRPGEGRFMESEHLQNSDVSWGHEPGLRKSLDCRQTTFRFMEREHLRKLDVSWGHEPLRLAEARSGARVCDPQRRWFMGRADSAKVHDLNAGQNFGE